MQQSPFGSPAKQRHTMLRNPTPLQLMELVGWSLLGWLYWMALMVFVVWTNAQFQVNASLHRQPQLVPNLYEYAAIGDAWQALSVTADMAQPVLLAIQGLEAIGAWELVKTTASKTNMMAATALMAAEPALNSVVTVGNELRAVARLEQTAQDAERYLAEPTIANLRLLAVSCEDGSRTLRQAQLHLDGLTYVFRPFAETIHGAFSTSADSVRGLAASMGIVAEPLVQLANTFDQVADPAGQLLHEAERYNKRLVVDAEALNEVRDSLATAQVRENAFTLYFFRSPVLWLLDHLLLSNSALFVLIAVRLLVAYRDAILGGVHSPGRQPGFASPPGY